MSGAALKSADKVTPDWLTEVLRRQDALAGVRVAAVSVTSSFPTLLSFIAKLGVTYDGTPPDGAPTRLFVKMTNEKCLSQGWTIGHSEVLFYRTGAATMKDPPIPRCYDAVYEEATKRFHLLLEDLSESHREFTDWPLPPATAECERIIETFARLHASLWGEPRLGKGIGPGLPDAERYVTGMVDSFARFADALGDRLSSERRRRCERMIAVRPLLQKRLASGRDLALIHGDAHVWNLFYPREGLSTDIRLVDWDAWRIRPGAWDLAYMMAVHWYPDRRRRLEDGLLQRYHRTLESEGVRGYDLDALRHDYRLALIDSLGVPLGQSGAKLPASIWWGHFERIMLAYEDLGCEELLDGI